MARTRKLDDDTLAAIIAEYEAGGKSIEQLARKHKVSYGTLRWHFTKLAVQRPDRPHQLRPVPAEPMKPIRRGNHLMRRFTQAEDEKILAWRTQIPPLSYTEIGRRLDRPQTSIIGRCNTLARRTLILEDD